MASKRERPPGSGHWELRGYTGTDDLGRRLYVTRTFHGTAAEAEDERLRFAVELLDQAVPAAGQGSVAALFTDWHAAHPWRTPKGRSKALEDIERYIVPQLGTLDVARLTDTDIDRFYAGLRRAKKPNTKSGRPLVASTIRRLHSTLHAGLEWGVRKHRLRVNPASAADVAAVPPTTVEAPDPNVVAAVIAHAGTPELAVFLKAAAGTGRRRQDILGLQRADVDLDHPDGASLAFSRRVIYLSGEGVKVEQLDKNRRAVRLGIDPHLAVALRSHLEAMDARAALFGARCARRAFVFSDDPACRAPWHPDSTSRRFAAAVGRAADAVKALEAPAEGAVPPAGELAALLAQLAPGDFTGVTLHTLRHFHATELLAAGIDIETVAHRLGDDPQTVHRVYSHFRPAGDRRAADVWGRLFGA